MDLILHIGHSKTGSTSIQSSLVASRSSLAHNGILYYTRNGDNHMDFNTLVGRKLYELEDCANSKKANTWKTVEKIKALASSNEYDYILLSCEAFFYFSEDELDTVIKIFGIHFDRVCIVCYVRPPISLYLSATQQLLKRSHHILSPYTFARNLSGIVNQWMHFVGADNFFVNAFHPKSLVNGCSISDFEAQLRSITQSDITLKRTSRFNSSLKAEQMVLLQDFRSDFLKEFHDTHHPSSSILLQFFSSLNSKDVWPMNKSLLLPCIERTIHENNNSYNKELDRFFKNVSYSELCAGELRQHAPALGQGIEINSARQLLERYDEATVKLCKRCVPFYNPTLFKTFDRELLTEPLIADNLTLMQCLAEYLILCGCNASAAGLLSHMLQSNPGNAFLRILLSQACHLLGDSNGAIKQARMAAELSKDIPQIQQFLGNLLYACGKPQEARKAFRRAAEIDPLSHDAADDGSARAGFDNQTARSDGPDRHLM